MSIAAGPRWPSYYSWPTMSFCPTSIMSSGSLFHFLTLSTVNAILPTDPIERFARLHDMNCGRSRASHNESVGPGIRSLRSDSESRFAQIHGIGASVQPAMPCASV